MRARRERSNKCCKICSLAARPGITIGCLISVSQKRVTCSLCRPRPFWKILLGGVRRKAEQDITRALGNIRRSPRAEIYAPFMALRPLALHFVERQHGLQSRW